MPIFKRLLGNFLIFTTFPPEDSLGLFVCYEGHIQDVKTAEIVFVAICLRLTPFFIKCLYYSTNLTVQIILDGFDKKSDKKSDIFSVFDLMNLVVKSTDERIPFSVLGYTMYIGAISYAVLTWGIT